MSALGHQVPFTSVGGEPCCCDDVPDGPPFCYTEYTEGSSCSANTFLGHRIRVPSEISKRLTANDNPNNAAILWPVSAGKIVSDATRIGIRLQTRIAGAGGGFIGSRSWTADLGVPNQMRAYRAGMWCDDNIVITRETNAVGTVKTFDSNQSPVNSFIMGYSRLRCYMFNIFTRKATYNENPELVNVCKVSISDPQDAVFWVAGELGTPYQQAVYLETPWFNISAHPLNYAFGQAQQVPSQITWNGTNIPQPGPVYPWISGSVFDSNIDTVVLRSNGPERVYFQQTAEFPWPENDLEEYRAAFLTDQDMRGIPYIGPILGGNFLSPGEPFTRIDTLFSKDDLQETVDEPVKGGFAYFLPFPGPPL